MNFDLIYRAQNLLKEKRLDESLDILYQLLEQQPNNPSFLYNISSILYMKMRNDDSLKMLQKAYKFEPRNVNILQGMSSIYWHRANYPKVIAVNKALVKINPLNPHYYITLSNVYRKEKNFQQAEYYIKEALKLDRDNVRAMGYLGLIYYLKGYYHQAIEWVEKSLSIKEDTEFINTLNQCHEKLENFDFILDPLRKKLSSDPDDKDNLYELCNKLVNYHRFDEFLEIKKKFFDGKENENVGTLNILGHYYLQMGNFDRAIEYFQRVVMITNLKETYIALFHCYLITEQFELAWKYYNKRWFLKEFRCAYGKLKPFKRWDEKTSLNGKTLFLEKEQGHGDMIQSFRYIFLLKEKYPKVKLVFIGQDSLNQLIKINFPDIEVVQDYPQVKCDYYYLLIELNQLFDKKDYKSVPFTEGYLKCEIDKDIVKLNDSKTNIGICWQGSPTHFNDLKRSINLRNFENLVKLDNFQWVSLQYLLEHQLDLYDWGKNVIKTGDKITNIYKCTQLINNLDLVITIDTSIVHIAGALGKKVWVLLPYLPDPRWGFKKEKSYLYDSVRLFHQTKHGSWYEPIQEVIKELGKLK